MLKAVILDLDETINTSPAYSRAFEETYLRMVSKRLGKPTDEVRVRIELAKRKLLSLTKTIE